MPKMRIKKRTVGKHKRTKYDEQNTSKKQVTALNKNTEFFNFLLRHTWNLCRLSPLYNIQYTEVRLKYYASCIKQALVENVQDASNNITFNVKINVTEIDLLDDPTKTLTIEITQRKEESVEQVKYRSIIFCFEDEKIDYNVTFAPLLLYAGTVSITNIVHATLQECFNTVVRQFKLSQENMKRLSLLNNFKKKDKIEYTYTVPQIIGRNFIKVSLESSDMHNLSNNLNLSNSGENFTEVDKFYKYLNREFSNMYLFNFDKLNIYKIVMPDVVLQSDGKIRFNLKENTMKTINFIINIAVILNNGQAEMQQ